MLSVFRARRALTVALCASTLSIASCGDDETNPVDPPDPDPKPQACELPEFEEGDPIGHPDPFGARAANQARAGIWKDAASIVQPAHGRQRIEPGDYVLANDRVAITIEKPGFSDGYARFGGEIVAIDQIGDDGRPRGLSKYGETLLSIAIEMIDPTSVTVMNDGSDGGEAVVRVKGALKTIPFLGEGPFAAFFPNPYALEGVVDYALAPGSDVLHVRMGVNNLGDEALNFGVGKTSSDEILGFFHMSQMQMATPERGFAEPRSKTEFVAFDGGDFGFAFKDIDGPLRYSLTQSGFNLFYGNGFIAEPCSQTLVPHVDVIAGGPDYDGIRAAVRRASNEPEERIVTGTLRDATGEPIPHAYVHEIAAADGAYLSRVRTNAEGRFAIHAPNAPVKLIPFVQGYPSHAGELIAPQQMSADLTLAPAGRLHVIATDDESGERLPVRVVVIPKAEVKAPPDAFGHRAEAHGRLHQDFAVSGESTLIVPPGEHRVIVTRGYEWEPHDTFAVVPAGETAQIDVKLKRSIDSTGIMCADFHIHSFMSMDSSDPIDLKVRGAVADGLEIPVSSEHEWIIDFQPVIERLGLQKWAFGMPSEELTTFKYGHFGIFPLEPDYGRANAGALDWIGKPVGTLFAEVHARPEAPVIIVNHPRSSALSAYFSSANFNRETGEGQGELWSGDFDFIEVFNESDLEANRKESVRDWFSLLNNGKRIFAVGSSDSHHLRSHPVGYPRTCIDFGHDDPQQLTRAAVRDALRTGAATVSGGLLMTVAGPNGEKPGDTVKCSGCNTATFTVTVQGPSFAKTSSLEVIVNGESVKTEELLPMGEGPGQRFVNQVDVPIPTGSKATPWVVFHAKGDADLAPLHPGKKAFAVSNPVFVDR